MKQEQITSLENKIKKEYGNITGIIVLKDNNAAYESYFNQCSEYDPIHIFSVTKSIISMLFGIALDKGCIKNLDDKLSNQEKGENNTACYNPESAYNDRPL